MLKRWNKQSTQIVELLICKKIFGFYLFIWYRFNLNFSNNIYCQIVHVINCIYAIFYIVRVIITLYYYSLLLKFIKLNLLK